MTGGVLHALSRNDAGTRGTDRIRYQISFTADDDENLSADADGIVTYDYATAAAIPGIEAFSAVRTPMETGSGTDAATVYKLEGKIGTQAFLDDDEMDGNVDLTWVAGSKASPASRVPLVAAWTDTLTWTSLAAVNVDGRTTSLTFDADLMLTGTVAGAACMLEQTQFAPAAGVSAFVAADMTIASCTDDSHNGEYAATAFLGSTDDSAAVTTNDRLYMIAVKPGTEASGEGAAAVPAADPVYRVFIGR